MGMKPPTSLQNCHGYWFMVLQLPFKTGRGMVVDSFNFPSKLAFPWVRNLQLPFKTGRLVQFIPATSLQTGQSQISVRWL